MPLLYTLGFYATMIYATWIAFLSIMALKSAQDNGKLANHTSYQPWAAHSH